jgi:hypothetical protein
MFGLQIPLKKDFQKLSCNQKGIKRISGLLVLKEQQHTLPEYVDALYRRQCWIKMQ